MNDSKTGNKISLMKVVNQTLKRYKSQDVYNTVKKSTSGLMQPSSNKNIKQIPEKKDISLVSPTKQNRIASYTQKIPKKENKPFSKILNDMSIQELDTEENIDNSNVDENDVKNSQLKHDFYTNSIGEGSNSPKKNLLINNLPKPFVKQNTKVLKFETNTDLNNSMDGEHRKFLISAKRGDRDVFLQCLDIIMNDPRGDLNYKDESGWTALHYSCDEGNLKIVDILIKSNVDINCKTNNKKTPIHLAVMHGYFDITKLLIENGCSINVIDDEKNTVIHICATMSHQELLKYLLDKCPEANSKNIYGHTPLMIAKKETIKSILKDYLKKNFSQYKKIHIHTTNNQSANNLLKKGGNDKNKRPQSKIKTSEINQITNKTQTSDFNIKTSDDKININITANIGTVNKVKVNDKVKVTVETKVSDIPASLTSFTPYKKNTQLYNFQINSDKRNKSKTPMTKLLTNSTNCASSGELKFNTKSNFNVVNKKLNDIKDLENKSDTKITKSISKQFMKTTSKLLYEDNSDRTNSSNMNTVLIDLTDPKPSLSEIEETAHNISDEDNNEEQIGPSSFYCHGLLGKGSFGEVYLVEKKTTGILYAMKVLSKDKVKGQNLVKYAMTERNVLSITNHPFMVKLNFAFQTNDKLFLILDYCPGGDLAEHLAKENRFKEDRAKLYLCEIILALEYLHLRDIIFRDLKPDNVVLDMDGHALLTDFGLSKEGVFDSKGAQSFCGSIAYLAPEMLKRKGHGKAVDWYLLGVLFYEMLVGIPPYFTNNKEQIFKNIERGELHIPKFVSDKAQLLLRSLLNKDPSIRLGSKNDAEEVKSHSYFEDVNWEVIYNKNTSPPIPKSNNKNLEKIKNPRFFEQSDEKSDSHFEGWSFINNDDKINKSSQV